VFDLKEVFLFQRKKNLWKAPRKGLVRRNPSGGGFPKLACLEYVEK
jgi:hypothetical protein